jgi:hypothetical protein
MEKNLADLSQLLPSLQVQNESIKVALEENTAVVRDLSAWKPRIETDVSNLWEDLGHLSDKVDELLAGRGTPQLELKVFDHLPLLVQASAQALLVNLDHATSHRSDGFRVVTTLRPPSVTGTPNFMRTHSSHTHMLNVVDPTLTTYQSHLDATLPQLDFPQFDGHHPKMWKAKCESYFDVLPFLRNCGLKSLQCILWGSTTFWLQSVNQAIRHTP